MSPTRLALCLPALLLVISATVSAQPVVINNLDGGPAPVGSLRWAATTAAPGDTITFNLAANDSLITLTHGEISIGKDLAFDGSGSAGIVTVSTNGTNRLFNIDTSEVWFTSIDLEGGSVPSGDGGCVLVDGGSLYMRGVNMRQCSARRGGAFFADTAFVSLGVANLGPRPEVADNSARHGAGGFSNESDVRIRSVDVKDNVADSSGGGIYALGDRLDLEYLNVSGNSAYEGGAVYLDNVAHGCLEADYIRNSAGYKGGGVFQNGGGSSFDTCEVSENRSEIGGGFYHSGGSVNLWFTIVARDTATIDGGGILTSGSAVFNALNSTIDRNVAEQTGGGIWVGDSYMNVNGSNVSNNRASAGGGIYGTSSSAVIVWNNSIVTQNRADLGNLGLDGGGGIYMAGTADSLWMSHSTVSLNFAKAGRGGGIFNSSPNAVITGSSHIIANEADGDGVGGGGIYNQGAMVVSGSRVAGNFTDSTAALSQGGGIYNFGHLTIESSTINSNQAKGQGGGIVNNDTLFVSNSTISANISKDDDGGGILNFEALSINNSTITLNEADQFGGGIYDHSVSPGPVTLYSSIVANNLASFRPDIRIGGAGSVTSVGYNLVGDSTGTKGMVDGVNNDQVGSAASPLTPLLAGLELNGGDTRTHALLPGSPAIDAGDCSVSVVTADQRGEPRPIDDPSAANVGDGCDVGAFELDAASAVAVDLRIWLEGPYNPAANRMPPDLNSFIPLTQPFDDAIFSGTRLEYDGLETLASVPDSAVDWVLVHLLTGDPANPPMTVVSTRAALVLTNGSVVELDGVSNLTFPGSTAGFYFASIYGRNHLGIMTADSVALSSVPALYDFSVAETTAYGVKPMSELETDVYGLWSSDGNADGQVIASDFNLWLVDTKAVATGYLQTDFNMDSQVTAADFNLWLVNTKGVVTSQVP